MAELYEALAADLPRADDYIPFLDRVGIPALELACGAGKPLLDLLDRGYEVEGLDSSLDMLDRCREEADRRGLKPQLHHGEMQSFQLERRYRGIFLAGASFTLLASDAAASAALACIHEHLEPGGCAMIPLEDEDESGLRSEIGISREVIGPAGACLRVTWLDVSSSDDGRNVSRLLRYERVPRSGAPTALERTWERRSFSQAQFEQLASASPFEEIFFLSPTGGLAGPDDRVFVALLRRG